MKFKLDGSKSAIRLFERSDASLRLAIAGSHDLTLDTPMFKKKVAEANEPLDPRLVRRVYGSHYEIRSVFDNSKVILLGEGTHHFTVRTRASLIIYASPHTPSLGDWCFQYRPGQGHEFAITSDVDVAITHELPKGIMDYANGQRTGSSDLFGVVARAQTAHALLWSHPQGLGCKTRCMEGRFQWGTFSYDWHWQREFTCGWKAFWYYPGEDPQDLLHDQPPQQRPAYNSRWHPCTIHQCCHWGYYWRIFGVAAVVSWPRASEGLSWSCHIRSYLISSFHSMLMKPGQLPYCNTNYIKITNERNIF